MKHNWNDLKWIFEPDGSLIDIYVQEISLSDWGKLIDLLNSKYLTQIDKEHAIAYLADDSGEMEGVSATLYLNKVQVNCHFFLPEQIEFDIDPKEINSIEDFQYVVAFMEDISVTLDNQVTLTGESSPEFPLVKIDCSSGINRVLTEQEAQHYWGKPNWIMSKIRLLKWGFQMKFFRKRFQEKLLNSANEPYKSTKKVDNAW